MQDIITAQYGEDILEFLDKEFPNVERWKYETYTKHFSNWHTSSIHQLLQALIEREEKSKVLEVMVAGGTTVREKSFYNKAKQDTINNLKTLQDSLR